MRRFLVLLAGGAAHGEGAGPEAAQRGPAVGHQSVRARVSHGLRRPIHEEDELAEARASALRGLGGGVVLVDEARDAGLHVRGDLVTGHQAVAVEVRAALDGLEQEAREHPHALPLVRLLVVGPRHQAEPHPSGGDVTQVAARARIEPGAPRRERQPRVARVRDEHHVLARVARQPVVELRHRDPGRHRSIATPVHREEIARAVLLRPRRGSMPGEVHEHPVVLPEIPGQDVPEELGDALLRRRGVVERGHLEVPRPERRGDGAGVTNRPGEVREGFVGVDPDDRRDGAAVDVLGAKRRARPGPASLKLEPARRARRGGGRAVGSAGAGGAGQRERSREDRGRPASARATYPCRHVGPNE